MFASDYPLAIAKHARIEKPNPRTHWRALDGMRGFAVVVVMVYHLGIPHLAPGGYLGVDIFFVLSGFLITSLLIGEFDAHRRVDLRAFYIRRALRLLPALLAVLVVFGVVVEVDPSARYLRHESLLGIPFVLFYVGNWLRIHTALGVFDHTWSLAIEEQFYLIFPAFFLFTRRRKIGRMGVAKLLMVLVVIEIALRAVLLAAGVTINTVGNVTFTHSDGLLLGAALAFWLASSQRRHFRSRTSHVLAGAGVLVLLVLTFIPVNSINSSAWYALILTLVPFATAVILFDQVISPQRWLALILGSRVAVWVGKRSYGLYLWHYPIYRLVILTKPPPQHRGLLDVVVFVGSFIVATVSYEIIEKPALRLKERFQRTEAMPASIEHVTG